MKRRKAGIIVSLIAVMAVFTIQGLSQEGARIALVNSQEVFEKSSEGKKAIVQLREREEGIKQELARLDDRIQELQTKFNTQRLTLTDEAMTQLASDLERTRTERKRKEEDFARDYQRLQLRLWQKVRDEVVPIIEQIASEKGVDIALDMAGASIVYFNPAIDITAEVVKRYDASKIK